jgi:hypothetical protein
VHNLDGMEKFGLMAHRTRKPDHCAVREAECSLGSRRCVGPLFILSILSKTLTFLAILSEIKAALASSLERKVQSLEHDNWMFEGDGKKN